MKRRQPITVLTGWMSLIGTFPPQSFFISDGLGSLWLSGCELSVGFSSGLILWIRSWTSEITTGLINRALNPELFTASPCPAYIYVANIPSFSLVLYDGTLRLAIRLKQNVQNEIAGTIGTFDLVKFSPEFLNPGQRWTFYTVCAVCVCVCGWCGVCASGTRKSVDEAGRIPLRVLGDFHRVSDFAFIQLKTEGKLQKSSFCCVSDETIINGPLIVWTTYQLREKQLDLIPQWPIKKFYRVWRNSKWTNLQ